MTSQTAADAPAADPRHAVVIGAGPGIGASVARRFAREGYRLTLIARTRSRLDALADELRTGGATADVQVADASDPAGYRSALEDVAGTAGPGVVVFNTAMLRPSRLLSVTADELLTGYSTDVIAAIVAAQVFVPGMRAAGSGTLLLTGGSAGVRPSPGIATVSLGKAALRSVGVMLATELKEDNIHVTSITVSGAVQPGTPFDPELIAEAYWQLHVQPRAGWTPEVPFDGGIAR